MLLTPATRETQRQPGASSPNTHGTNLRVVPLHQAANRASVHLRPALCRKPFATATTAHNLSEARQGTLSFACSREIAYDVVVEAFTVTDTMPIGYVVTTKRILATQFIPPFAFYNVPQAIECVMLSVLVLNAPTFR